MHNLEEERKLKIAACELKNNVKKIKDKLEKQDLLIESIESSTHQNVLAVSRSRNKFFKAISALRKDTRNFLILILLVFIVLLVVYLFPS